MTCNSMKESQLCRVREGGPFLPAKMSASCATPSLFMQTNL